MSQITTHVLDTACGKPASGIPIALYVNEGDEWTEIARGTTDEDGRIINLLQSNVPLPGSTYKLRFETKDYFSKSGTNTFYPYVEVIFDVQSEEHYHVPLLLTPFGYSTYRGS